MSEKNVKTDRKTEMSSIKREQYEY